MAPSSAPDVLAALSRALLLYAWFPSAALVGFLLLIARFYGTFAGWRARWPLFYVPVVLLGLAAVRAASVDAPFDDAWANLFLGIGGVLLAVLSVRLAWRMLRASDPS